MRQVQLHEEEHQFASLVSQAEAGESLTIVRHGKAVAQIIPFPESNEPSRAERMAALGQLDVLMARGYDQGGFKTRNRDELYDRDLSLQSREEALRELDTLLENAVPLGGTPPTRDEMHDGR